MIRTLTVLCLLLALAVTGCGGGTNTADATNAEARFIPNIDSAEGVTETYARAIETQNISLVEMVALDSEREQVVAQFRKNFLESEKQGIGWKIKFDNSTRVNDSMVYDRVTYIQMKDDKPTGGTQVGWVVFVKIEDGTWHFSTEKSKQLAAAKAGENEPGNQPAGNQPDKGNSPPAGND